MAKYHEHRLEEIAKVYLRLDENERWTIDHLSDDGHPLDGYDNGVVDTECEHEDGTEDEHDALMQRANNTDLPTLPQLFTMLLDHFYPHDKPPLDGGREAIEAWLRDR